MRHLVSARREGDVVDDDTRTSQLLADGHDGWRRETLSSSIQLQCRHAGEWGLRVVALVLSGTPSLFNYIARPPNMLDVVLDTSEYIPPADYGPIRLPEGSISTPQLGLHKADGYVGRDNKFVIWDLAGRKNFAADRHRSLAILTRARHSLEIIEDAAAIRHSTTGLQRNEPRAFGS